MFNIQELLLLYFQAYLDNSFMREVLLSLSTGTIVGAIFSLVKLPIPAPSALSGVAGIVGIYLGYVGIVYLLKFFG